VTEIITIGLTGGIACGKSSVLKIIAKYGVKIISADELAHRALELDNPGYQNVINEFGYSIINENGQIDRKKLGAIVFTDNQARKRLESIIHPIVISEIKEQILFWRSQGLKILVVEVPLLFEVGMADLFDQVWVVSATFEEQLQRLQTRDHLSAEEACGRIKAQLPWLKTKTICIGLQNGVLNLRELEQVLKQNRGRIKLLAVRGASNVTGYTPPIYTLAEMAHYAGTKVLVDGAQLAPHRQVKLYPANDPRHLDFFAFSGHKMYAPFGVGV
jgi:dephospho-CoA kinase